jgi:hypothetical protein
VGRAVGAGATAPHEIRAAEYGDAGVTNVDENSLELVTRLSLPNDAGVTSDSDEDVTARVTSVSPKTENTNQEESGKGNSLAAGEPAPTSASILFSECRQYLERATGMSSGQARRVVGGWRKSFSDSAIIDAASRAQREEAQDPVAFIMGCLRHSRNRSEVGAMSAIAAMEGVNL